MVGVADKACRERVHSQQILLEILIERVLQDVSTTLVIELNDIQNVMHLRGQIGNDTAKNPVSEFVIEVSEIQIKKIVKSIARRLLNVTENPQNRRDVAEVRRFLASSNPVEHDET